MWDVLFYRLNNLYLPAGCPQGMCQHIDYSGGDIDVFGPSGTTCCTDGKRTWAVRPQVNYSNWGFARGIPELWGFKYGGAFPPNIQRPLVAKL